MIYKLLIVLAAVICWSIIKISSSIRKNEKNIDPEEEINLYGQLCYMQLFISFCLHRHIAY